MLQDNQRFIWIGTDNGVIRYDGNEFRCYKSGIDSPDRLSNNKVLSLAEDAQNIWIGTMSGLNRMDKKTGIIEKIGNKELQKKQIFKIAPDKNNILWIGTNKSLIKYFIKRDSVRIFPYQINADQHNNGETKDILLDSKNRMWLTIWGQGLYRFDKIKQTFIRYPRPDKINAVQSLMEDENGTIWMTCREHGIFKLINENSPSSVEYQNFRHVREEPNSLPHNIVYEITQNPKNKHIWAATRSGISSLTDKNNPNSFKHYDFSNQNDLLSNTEINTLLFDKSGLLWIGAYGKGLIKINQNRAKVEANELENTDVITRKAIYSIYQFKDGRIWMGIFTNGIVEYNPETKIYRRVQTYPGMESLRFINTATSICPIPHKNEILIGTRYGGYFVVHLDKNQKPISVQHFVKKTGARIESNNNIRCFTDRETNLIITSSKGVNIYTNANDTISLSSRGNESIESPIQTFAEDRNGNYWFGSLQSGVIKVSRKNNEYLFEDYNVENGKINNNNIISIFCDSLGHIWAGTNAGGLNRYNPTLNKFESLNKEFNIPYDEVFNISQSNKNDLWICGKNGVVKLILDRSGKLLSQTTLSSSDGLFDNGFIIGAFAKGNRGELIIGGHKGYVTIDPKQTFEKSMGSRTTITDIKIANRSIFGTKNERLISQTEGRMAIKLLHSDNSLSIEFSAMCFNNPGQNRYAYQMIGVDKEWQYVDANRNFASYNNLEKGNYTFQVISSNENGEWNVTPTYIDITVEPSIFDTTLAYIIYFIILSIIFGIILYLVSKNARIKAIQQLTLQEKEKSEELNQLKLNFFTNISHELLTPLSIISCGVEDLVSKSGQNEEEGVRIVRGNINRLTRLIRQVLEFKKAESGNLKLMVSYGDMVSFIENICQNNFKPLIHERQIHFSFLPMKKEIFGYFDSDKIDKIIYNLLSNAFKYNRPNGYVQVVLSEEVINEKRLLKLSVKDNGQGIAKEKQQTIFNRYFDGDYRKFNTTGTGIGMSLTKELVELHHGTINLISEIGKGTEFIVRFPIDEKEYLSSEIDEVEIVEETSDEIPTNQDFTHEYTLLIVEDSIELNLMMKEVLSKIYNVLVAENGEQALEVLHKNLVNVIVSDVMMPIMDGFTLCERVKSDVNLSHIPMLLLTAKSGEEDRILGYESGADEYLLKPFNLNVLLSRIKNLLEKRESYIKEFRSQENTIYSSIDEKFLTKAISIVDKNLDNADFTFEDFVAEMNVTKSTLYRKIKVLTGMTTSDFIKNIRLKNACQIMQTKKVSVSEMAYAVGFDDPKYFSTCFKKEFGVLPTEYMARYHK